MDLNWMLEEYDGIVYVSDIETYELIYMNKLGCQFLNIKLADALEHKKKCYKVLQGRDAPCPFCTNHIINEKNFYEWEHYNPLLKQTLLLKDRKLIWEGRPARIEYATDVSKYHDKIVRKEKERESLLKSVPGGIARVDARNMRSILWYGANFLTMIGYTKEQFETELHSECNYVYPPDMEVAIQMMTALKETGGSTIMEMKIVTRSGDIRTLTTTLSYEDGSESEDGIPSFYSVGIDITEMKEAQERSNAALEEAYQAAKMANIAKTDFLSRMSHDIRTPMNAVLGMTMIAKSNMNNTLKVSDCLDKITSSSHHLLSLINEVLDMSKVESGRLVLDDENFEMADLVQNVLNLCLPLLADKQQHLKVNIRNIIHERVIGDMERLQQVMINLLGNAVKYTPHGGHITLTIIEKTLHISGASRFEFVFEDDGIGMPEEFLKHVFEPFARAEDSRISKIQGTGLGMTISENIIHMMNGIIQVESAIGKGSKFTVDVPLKLQDEQTQNLDTLKGLSVLVVDDDSAVCESTSLMLNGIGMDSHWTQSGRHALEELTKAKNNGKDYFAVLLDWKMPDFGGMETARAIRAQIGTKIPIIIISAYDYSEIENDMLDVSIDAFITKPLFKSKVLQILEQFANIENNPAHKVKLSVTEELNGRKILLVEDNELNREIAAQLLSMAGAHVECVQNGKEAVEQFSLSREGEFDAILMDIQMPIMNGYEATSAIRCLDRKDSKCVPIIALTANAFTEDIAASKNSGMDGHISKPIDLEKMKHTILSFLK